tara:strand:+ start:1798 stop:2211 length:414 start_codon:yes stop_codon:yes gene_type:complete
MLLESKTVELNGSSYQITQFTATKGVKFFRKVSKYLSPLVGLMGAKDGDGDAVSQAIEALLDNLGDDSFDILVKELVTSSGFVGEDGTQIKFDYFFAGNYGSLITLITEIVKFNYETVFQGGVFENLSAQIPMIVDQ